MAILKERPAQMDGELFDLLFNSAEIANFAPRELNEYLADMETIRDRLSQLATAERAGREKGRKEGREEGREEGLKQAISRLLAFGMSPEDISKALGVPISEIRAD